MQAADTVKKVRRRSVRWLNSDNAETVWPTKRRNVIVSFWYTILLGLPLWYFTTQVSRAPLPQIPRFESLKPRISVRLEGAQSFSTHKLVTGLNLLQDVHEFTNETLNDDPYVVSWQESTAFSSSILPGTRQWDIRSTAAQSSNLEESIAAYMLGIFQDERRRIASIVDPSSTSPDLRVVKYNPAYDLVFSLLNGGGNRAINAWPIKTSLEKVVAPVLRDIGSLANFSMESQIQHYAELTFDPMFDERSGNHILQKSDLKSFINSAEWNLATAQSENKPLNFIIYVPKPEHRPLVIVDGDQLVETNSFLLPQFGAIAIYNPPSDSSSAVLPPDVLDFLVEICTAHLLTLLGLPAIPEAFGDASQWRRDGLLRQRVVETITSAQQSLHSIPKIVDQIPNMHVPRHVAASIEEALGALATARLAVEQGDLEAALMSGKVAVRKAEEAFFNHKMVSLLYFPDEHKYGVYMPLFGPLFLPLFLAGLKEISYFLKQRKLRRTKPTNDGSSRQQVE